MADQRTLMAVCGNMEQIAGVRRIEFQDGRASGTPLCACGKRTGGDVVNDR